MMLENIALLGCSNGRYHCQKLVSECPKVWALQGKLQCLQRQGLYVSVCLRILKVRDHLRIGCTTGERPARGLDRCQCSG